MKSNAIEMQGLFPIVGSLAVLFADGLPYVLCLDPYHLLQHPIWFTQFSFSISPFFYYKLVIVLQIHTCSPGVKETVLNGEAFMSDSLKNYEMKALDPQILEHFQ